jgi:UDP-N-acetylmuramate--alanine ligase
MFRRLTGLRHVHFVGIGGAGMSGIAELLLDYELEVSGSDLVASPTTERLERLGAQIWIGHAAEHANGADVLVVSSAVDRSNPEVERARERGVPVVRRAEMLAELMRLKYGIAVAGTHGKTTTTSLVGAVLTEGGLDPTVVVGGRLRVSGTGARHGQGEYLVAEADEYDRSFLYLHPIIAVVTTIDEDHLDTYGSFEAIEEAFLDFAGRVPFFGRVIACSDEEPVRRMLRSLEERRVVTYGLGEDADLRAAHVVAHRRGSSFTVRHAGRELGRIELPMPGAHNVRNALAAVAVGLALDLDFALVARALDTFSGVHRRFERLGRWHGAEVVDDYAHHPTEVRATLEAARQVFAEGAIHAVFQPHLYSRTQRLAEDFGRALLGADHAVVTAIYGSRERPLPGVSAELVVEAARRLGHRRIEHCAEWHEVPQRLAGTVAEGDVVLTLGAGDVYRLAEALVQEETS